MKDNKKTETAGKMQGTNPCGGFQYGITIKDLIEMLTTCSQFLQQTIKKIESLYSKASSPLVCLNLSQYLNLVWENCAQGTNLKLLYPVFGNQIFSIKATINKRNNMLGYLNIMLDHLKQKFKENKQNYALYYSNEEELYNIMLKIFHSKLFECPIFRKVCA